jgi:hypothetical protein
MSSTGVEGVDSPSGQTNVEEVDLSLSMQGPKALNVDDASPQAPLRAFPDHALRPLPDNWHVNGAHVALANKHGINCRALANIWRRWIEGTSTASGPRQSTNWDRFFAHVILAIGVGGDHWGTDGPAGFDPDGRHLFLDEFGDVDGWYERGSTSVIWLDGSNEEDLPEARATLPLGQVYGDEWSGSNACRFACRDHGLDFEDEIERFRNENSDSADSPMNFEKRFISSVRSVRV